MHNKNEKMKRITWKESHDAGYGLDFWTLLGDFKGYEFDVRYDCCQTVKKPSCGLVLNIRRSTLALGLYFVGSEQEAMDHAEIWLDLEIQNVIEFADSLKQYPVTEEDIQRMSHEYGENEAHGDKYFADTNYKNGLRKGLSLGSIVSLSYEDKKVIDIKNKAIQWAIDVFKKLADQGRYPEFLLAQNGGDGIMPLVNAMELTKSNMIPASKPLLAVSDKEKVKLFHILYPSHDKKDWTDKDRVEEVNRDFLQKNRQPHLSLEAWQYLEYNGYEVPRYYPGQK